MRFKKHLVILLTCIFIFGLTASGAVAQKDPMQLKFRDMTQAQWAAKQVYKMAAENVIIGYTDGTFQPNKPVTQAEAVVLTMRAAGYQDKVDNIKKEIGDSNFKDTVPEWAYKAVTFAKDNDFVESTANEQFQPNKAASREWVIRLIIRTFGFEDEARKKVNIQLNFKDEKNISADTVGYIATALENNITVGYPDGTFQPNKPVTRAEMAVWLDRTSDELPLPGVIGNVIQGKITDVTTIDYVYQEIDVQGKLTLEINNKDEDEVTYPVAADALIYIYGEKSGLEDVEELVGSFAKVIVDNRGIAVYIEIEPLTVKGVITEVYDDKITIIESQLSKERNLNRNRGQNDEPEREREINIDINAEPVTYKIDSDVEVILNGQEAAIDDLAIGNFVKLVLDEDEKVVIIQAWTFIKKQIEDKQSDNKQSDNKQSDNKQSDGAQKDVNQTGGNEANSNPKQGSEIDDQQLGNHRGQ